MQLARMTFRNRRSALFLVGVHVDDELLERVLDFLKLRKSSMARSSASQLMPNPDMSELMRVAVHEVDVVHVEALHDVFGSR